MAIATDGPTPLSLPASLRPHGWGRYFDAVFLLCWLAMWVVGEVVVATLGFTTIASLIAASLGIPLPAILPKTIDPGVASGFLLFALVWLTIWTVGGIAAGTHLLRGLAGEDRVSLTPDSLVVYRRAWIFHRTRTFPRADIRRVSVHTSDRSVAIYTGTSGMQAVATLGTPRDREELRAALVEALALPDATTLKRLEQQTVPPQWEAERRGADLILRRPSRRTRRQQATTMWIVTGLVSLGVIASVTTFTMAIERGGGFVLDKLSWSLSTLCGLLAAWITWGGTEWTVRTGRLTHRLYFAGWARERVFEGVTLELSMSTDSDGDVHHALHVSGPGGRKKITSSVNESCELVWLGEWLAHQTGFPFEKAA